MTISSANHRNYIIQFACLTCAGSHHLRLARKDFWGEQIQYLRCPDLGTEIGYLGPEQAVSRLVEDGRSKPDSIANDLGFNEFFNYPDVMLEILGHLHFLAENDNIACQCGNVHIEVEVFPDKLELRCLSCESLLIIYAETKEDLAIVRRMPRIVMMEKGFASIDASKLSQER